MDDTGLVPVGVVATRPLVAEMLPDAAFPPADLPQPEATSANTETTAAAAPMPRLPALSPPAHAHRRPPDPGMGARRTADVVVADSAEIGVDDREVRVHALPDRAGRRLYAVGPG